MKKTNENTATMTTKAIESINTHNTMIVSTHHDLNKVATATIPTFETPKPETMTRKEFTPCERLPKESNYDYFARCHTAERIAYKVCLNMFCHGNMTAYALVMGENLPYCREDIAQDISCAFGVYMLTGEVFDYDDIDNVIVSENPVNPYNADNTLTDDCFLKLWRYIDTKLSREKRRAGTKATLTYTDADGIEHEKQYTTTFVKSVCSIADIETEYDYNTFYQSLDVQERFWVKCRLKGFGRVEGTRAFAKRFHLKETTAESRWKACKESVRKTWEKSFGKHEK